MCTLLYVPLETGRYQAFIGLNRDEAYARPAAPPRWWPPEDGEDGAGPETVRFVAPVDLVAGGTWFGVAASGLFVALTNGRQDGPFRHERSRGALVTAALRYGDIASAAAWLAGQDAFAYAPCHLLLAQGDEVVYVAPDERGRFAITQLARGPHTLTNAGLDAGDTPPLPTLSAVPSISTVSALPAAPGARGKADSAEAGDEGVGETGDADAGAIVAALWEVLATHEGPLARCRHGADRGTRSSAVLLLGPSLRESRLSFAEGPPCTTAFVEVDLAVAPPISWQRQGGRMTITRTTTTTKPSAK